MRRKVNDDPEMSRVKLRTDFIVSPVKKLIFQNKNCHNHSVDYSLHIG